MHEEPITFGRCEAGMQAFRLAAHLDPCEKRARWVVDGVLLCGGCRRIVKKGLDKPPADPHT